ncbi:MAG: DUF6531 domain-containing protein, partial [Candidatus Gracilibacteria bacterium]|nr:DUF6531 domain-containing protein [Candidatus Gracilibacteria bacterium]
MSTINKYIKIFILLIISIFVFLITYITQVLALSEEFGGISIYNDPTDSDRLYFIDLDSGTKTKLGLENYARGVYKDKGIIYEKYDSISGTNILYYRDLKSITEKALFDVPLGGRGYMLNINKETGNFVYYIDNGNGENGFYEKNVLNSGSGELLVGGDGIRLQAISNDYNKIIYNRYYPETGESINYLKNLTTGEEVSLGTAHIESESYFLDSYFSFTETEDELIKTTSIYNFNTREQTTQNWIVDTSDYDDLIYTSLNLDVGQYGQIIGKKGTDIYYMNYDNNWTQHTYIHTGTGDTEIIPAGAYLSYNPLNGKILSYGDNIIYNYYNTINNKQQTQYKNLATSEINELYDGSNNYNSIYLRDKNATNTGETSFCTGELSLCGTEITNYTQIGDYIYKSFSNKVGFIGTDYEEKDFNTNSPGFVGYIGTNNTENFTSNLPGFIGYIGNNNTESGTISISTNTIGYIGNNYKAIIPSRKILLQDHFQLDKSTNSPIKTETAVKENETTNTKTGSKLDPVNPNTGEFTYDNTLMQLPGVGQSYELSVSYRSRIQTETSLGVNWTHNYDIHLLDNENGTYELLNGQSGMQKIEGSGTTIQEDTETEIKDLDAKLIKYSNNLGYKLTYKDKKVYNFNSNGDISSIQDANGNTITFTYNENNQLSDVIDTLGRDIKYTYDETYKLKRVTDPDGRYVEFSYYGDMETDGSLYDLKSIKIHNSDNTEIPTEQKEKTIKFTYYKNSTDNKLSNNIKTLLDSKNQIYVTNTYDINDRVISQTYGDGTGTYEYTLADIHADDTPETVGNGIVIGTYVSKNKVTDKRGIVTEYYYNRMGNVVTRKSYNEANTGSTQVSYEYDEVGRMTKEINPKGNGKTYKYDTNGNKTEERQKTNVSNPDDDTEDLVTRYEYDQTTNLLTKTILANNTEIDFTYDTNNNLTQTEIKDVKLGLSSSPISLITQNQYNGSGQLVKTIDAELNETSYEYTNGQITKVIKGTEGNQIIETYTYDNYGNLVSKTDPLGNIQTMQYDELNRVKEITSAEGITRKYEYDQNDNKILDSLVLDETNAVNTNITYNLLDKPTQVTTKISQTQTGTISTVYDGNENITEITYADGTKKQYKYNELEQVIEEKTITTNQTITINYEYDINGNKTKIIDPKGNQTNIEYDLFDRPIKQIDSLGNYITYTYDKQGKVIETNTYNNTNTKVQETQITYNKIGQILKQEAIDLNPDGTPKTENAHNIITKQEYNKNGQVVKQIDSKGNETAINYDQFNRPIETIDQKGNKQVNTYDKNNNIIQKQIVQTNGKTTTTSYTYDGDNRLIKSKQILNGQELISELTYNKLGNVIKSKDANGNETNYTYDYRGKVLSETKDPETSSGGQVVTNYSYDINGNLIKVVDSNNNETNYTYNSLNQLTKQIYPNNKEANYTYDINGNLLTITDPNGNITTNTYDNLNRLTNKTIQKATGVEGITSENYTYDSLGRLIEANDSNNHKLDFTYDSLGRL